MLAQAEIVAVEEDRAGTAQRGGTDLGDVEHDDILPFGIQAADIVVLVHQCDQQLAAGERHATGGGRVLHQRHAGDVLVDADIGPVDQRWSGSPVVVVSPTVSAV